MRNLFEPKIIQKRHFLILEVLIAFSLIVLCILPLLHPHFYIYKTQKSFLNRTKLNHAVNLFYTNILEKMHTNEIKLQDVLSNRVVPVEDGSFQNFPSYKGSYQLSYKYKEYPDFTKFKVSLKLMLKPTDKGRVITYSYIIPVGYAGSPLNLSKEAVDKSEVDAGEELGEEGKQKVEEATANEE